MSTRVCTMHSGNKAHPASREAPCPSPLLTPVCCPLTKWSASRPTKTFRVWLAGRDLACCTVSEVVQLRMRCTPPPPSLPAAARRRPMLEAGLPLLLPWKPLLGLKPAGPRPLPTPNTSTPGCFPWTGFPPCLQNLRVSGLLFCLLRYP